MRLYFIRHGESHVNVALDFSSLPSMDAELTEKGHQQAAALRDWMRKTEMKGDVLYSSTMRRAKETAAYVAEALNLPVVFEDRLREIGTAYSTGLPIEAENLPRKFGEEWADVTPFSSNVLDYDGVETWMHLRIRLAQFVEFLAQKHAQQQVYVIAHGGVIGAMFDNLFNVGPYRRAEIHTYNTGWSMFMYRPEHRYKPWSIYMHNRIDHLIEAGLA